MPSRPKNFLIGETENMQPSFSERVRQRREALGLSKAEVARKAGISPSYMTYLEQGKLGRNPSAWIVNNLAKALRTSIDELLPEDFADSSSKKQIMALAERLSKLKEKDRQIILQILNLVESIDER